MELNRRIDPLPRKILRIVGVCSFVLGSFLVGAEAQASCGDYLMLLGHHGQSGTQEAAGDERFSGIDRIAEEMISVRYQFPKCRGRGCGQAPKNSETGSAAVLVSRVVVGVGILVAAQPHARPLMIVRYLHLTSNLAAQQEASELFRPPRLCA